jgi:SAM-dependent methyltransferase
VSDIGLYSDPRVYDSLHTPGTADEVDGLLRTEAAFSVPNGHPRLWLEPACGSGRYLRVARARGIDGVGFDISPGMIAYARARAARARSSAHERYFVASMTDFAAGVAGPATFAFNLINTVRHLESDAAVLAHFREMARVLAPGAVYAVGLSLSAYGLEGPSEDVWDGARGPCRVRQVVQFIPPLAGRDERVVSHLSIRTPAGEEHRTSSYSLRTYDLAQWRGLVGRSALRIHAAVDGDGALIDPAEPGYAVFLLSARPGSYT